MTIEHVETLLLELQAILSELLRVQAEKRLALAKMDAEGLDRLSEQEGLLVERMAAASQRRSELLARLDVAPQPARSLRSLVTALPVQKRLPLMERLDTVRRTAQRVKQQACANWLITYRSNQYLHRLLEIIAQAGRPTVGETRPGAGLLLDRTA